MPKPKYCKSVGYRVAGKFAAGLSRIGTLADTAFVGSIALKIPGGAIVSAKVAVGAGALESVAYATQGLLGDASKFRSSATALAGAFLPDPFVPKSLKTEVGDFITSKLIGAAANSIPNQSPCD